jgi:hypothetical protein
MSTSTLVAGPLPKIGRPELAQIPVPEATLTHRPVPHHVIVEALVETLSFRHIGVVNEEYAVSFDGMKMFGVLDLETQMEGCRFSIGIRNSHDKSIRLGLTSGLRVFVCSNMAFSGEFTPATMRQLSRLRPLEASVRVEAPKRCKERTRRQRESEFRNPFPPNLAASETRSANPRGTETVYVRDNETTMDSRPESRASCVTRKTILMTSGPISTRCTSVRIISRLRCQSALSRCGPTTAASSRRRFAATRRCSS